jgi:hypothetical protein
MMKKRASVSAMATGIVFLAMAVLMAPSMSSLPGVAAVPDLDLCADEVRGSACCATWTVEDKTECQTGELVSGCALFCFAWDTCLTDCDAVTGASLGAGTTKTGYVWISYCIDQGSRMKRRKCGFLCNCSGTIVELNLACPRRTNQWSNC